MTYDEFKHKFLNWALENLEPIQENGFPICPFAKSARLKNEIQFIDATYDAFNACKTFNNKKYKLGVAWLDNNLADLNFLIETLETTNKNLLYFASTTDSGYFVKNFTNCIFIQDKDDISKKRKYLQNTSYYDNWPKEYLTEITKNA